MIDTIKDRIHFLKIDQSKYNTHCEVSSVPIPALAGMVEVGTWFSVWFWLNATEVTNQEFQKKGSEVYEDWKVSLRWIKK